MLVFSRRARAFVEHSIDVFGTSDEKRRWAKWAAENPYENTDRVDDGKGPMPTAFSEMIVECLHRRYDFLLMRMYSPIASEDEIADDCNDAGYLRAIATAISGEELFWKT